MRNELYDAGLYHKSAGTKKNDGRVNAKCDQTMIMKKFFVVILFVFLGVAQAREEVGDMPGLDKEQITLGEVPTNTTWTTPCGRTRSVDPKLEFQDLDKTTAGEKAPGEAVKY